MARQREATAGKRQPDSPHVLPSKPKAINRPASIGTEEQLRKRIVYEKMLARISKNAVKVNDLDEFLLEVIEDVGPVMDVSRAFLCISHPPTSNFTCISEWTAPDADSMTDLRALTMKLP